MRDQPITSSSYLFISPKRRACIFKVFFTTLCTHQKIRQEMESWRLTQIRVQRFSFSSMHGMGSLATSSSMAAPTLGEVDLPCCCRGLALRRGLSLWNPLCLDVSLCPLGGSTSCCCWSSLGLTYCSPEDGTPCVQSVPAGWKWQRGQTGQSGQSSRLCCQHLSRLPPVSHVSRKHHQTHRFFFVSGCELCCRPLRPSQ